MYDIHSISVTDTGKVRAINEDALLESAEVFAVADGMGGHNAGEVASSMAVSLLGDYLSANRRELPAAELLKRAIESINKSIFEKASSAAELNEMGTTLTVLYFIDGGVMIGNVGDSRAYLLRDGRLKRLTHDDSLVAKLIEEGVINEEEAGKHPQRNIILKALGVEPHLDVEVENREVKPDDLFLLSTDGLTSLVEDEEIEEILKKDHDVRKKAKRLLKGALEKGGTDNITIILVEIDERGDSALPDSYGRRSRVERGGLFRFLRGEGRR